MEKREKEFLLLSVLSMILLSSIVSAEIIISQPKSLYNFGDSLDLNVKIIPSKDTRNFFTASLVCPTEEIELYKSPLNLKSGEEKEIHISIILDKLIVSQGGKCSLRANYDIETASSQSFELLSTIKVDLDIESLSYNPGEEIKVSGTAAKFNSEPLEGFVEISVAELGISLIRPVQSGSFNFNFTTPASAMSGDYKADIKAYEKDEFGEVINEGVSSSNFRIRQVMNELDIALTSQTVHPNSEISYTPIAYDQAGDKMDAEVTVTIYLPDNSIFTKSLARTDQTSSLFIESNYTPGSWKIEASSGSFKKTREFTVEEYKNITFELVNNSLTVKNTGNVPFEGPVEILIGGVKEIKDLALGVGKDKYFRLKAPDGDYEVKIGDSSGEHLLGTTFLTGSAISVDDSLNNSSDNFLIILWLVVILIIVIIAMILYKKVSRKTYIGKAPPAITGSNSAKTVPLVRQQNSVVEGEKQECSIVALKVKNISELKGNQEALNTIENALFKVKELGGRVYPDGDHRIIVLAPLLTKEQDNSMKAVKVAMLLERIFKEYNTKSLRKIDYGIGITLGNLIVESKDNKFKFVAPDNSVVSAKSMSQFSNNDILLSEVFHRKTIGKAKAKKLSDKNFWQLERVPDREKHEEFINKFKKRNKEQNNNFGTKR